MNNNQTKDLPDMLMGKKEVFQETPLPNFIQKAKEIGFSSREIDSLKRLYERNNLPELS